jgi:hypothetical protein
MTSLPFRSKEEVRRAIANAVREGLVALPDLASIENIPAHPVKDPVAIYRGRLTIKTKQAMNPPLCRKSGCECICKFYPEMKSEDGFVIKAETFGKLCVKHAAEAAEETKAAKRAMKITEERRLAALRRKNKCL